MRCDHSRRTLPRALALPLSLLLAVGAAACGSEGGDDDDDGDPAATRTVSGTVVDFETGEALAGSATISTSGIEPPPSVSVSGADFVIEDVPPFSVFNILSGSPPDYRSTYNVATVVDDYDLVDVTAWALSEDFIARLGQAFGVSAPQGILLARAIDEAGNGRAGVPATAFALADATGYMGPYFLDADLAPDPALTQTSESGWVVFLGVEAGLTAVVAADGSDYTMNMSASPIAATAATLGEVIVSDGPPQLPQNVSFAEDVVPIFEARGCDACHSGNGIGRDLGNLTLDGSANLIFREVTEELSPATQLTRVNLEVPESSLLLTMPSAEDPPDRHPNITFGSPQDPDYQTILAWISEGALDN